MTRRRRWELQDEDAAYSHTQLDRDIVNPDQIRTFIRTFRDKLPEIFPDHIATSVHIDTKALEFAPFDRAGGLGEFYEQFDEQYETVLDEINEALVV